MLFLLVSRRKSFIKMGEGNLVSVVVNVDDDSGGGVNVVGFKTNFFAARFSFTCYSSSSPSSSSSSLASSLLMLLLEKEDSEKL